MNSVLRRRTHHPESRIGPARGRPGRPGKLAISGALPVLFLLSACTDTAGEEDAPFAERHEDAREVWVMGDDYSNISPVCIGDNGVYVQRSDPAPPQIVKDDANCKPGGILYVEGDEHNNANG